MISIITATYNRAKYLPRLFDSLVRQTNKNFEWIVIDDGSIDNTESVICEYSSRDLEFDIFYIKQDNGGKHRAVNKGVQKAQGDYCFLVDSDDYLVDNAIALIYSWINNIHDENIVGVSGLRIYADGTCTNNVVMDSHFCDLKNNERYKIGLNNDCAEVYRRDILLKYPFPEFKGENFISEVAVWNKIACDGYKLRWYFTPIYVCEYLDTGLSKNIKKKMIENPEGIFYVVRLGKKYSSLKNQYKNIGFVCSTMNSGGYSYSYIAKKIEQPQLLCVMLSALYRIKHKGDLHE